MVQNNKDFVLVIMFKWFNFEYKEIFSQIKYISNSITRFIFCLLLFCAIFQNEFFIYNLLKYRRLVFFPYYFCYKNL